MNQPDEVRENTYEQDAVAMIVKHFDCPWCIAKKGQSCIINNQPDPWRHEFIHLARVSLGKIYLPSITDQERIAAQREVLEELSYLSPSKIYTHINQLLAELGKGGK